MKKNFLLFMLVFIVVFSACSNNLVDPWSGPVNSSNPSATVKMIFIHHSTGGSWLANGDGNLGTALNAANFYVTESDYGWDGNMTTECDNNYTSPSDPNPTIGDHTDTWDWPCWFNTTTMASVYANSSHSAYNNSIAEPSAENEIIMFKSCFPNSEVGDDITDEQAIYNGLLAYFASRTDKMFVLIVPPPMVNISNPAKTREISNWLSDRKNGWLRSYNSGNVFVFDYYNVLTHPDNHHYISGNYEYHVVTNPQNTLYYPTGDDHPNYVGQQKATSEFVPLLKAWWHQWKGF